MDYIQSLFATALGIIVNSIYISHQVPDFLDRTFTGFFQLNHAFEVRIGVLYALYLLYETQSPAKTSSHKYKINVSLGTSSI